MCNCRSNMGTEGSKRLRRQFWLTRKGREGRAGRASQIRCTAGRRQGRLGEGVAGGRAGAAAGGERAGCAGPRPPPPAPGALTAEPARAGVLVLEAEEAAVRGAAAHVPQHPEQLQQHERREEAQQVALAHARGVHGPGQQQQQPRHEHVQPVLAAQRLGQLLRDAGADGAPPRGRRLRGPRGRGRGRWADRGPRWPSVRGAPSRPGRGRRPPASGHHGVTRPAPSPVPAVAASRAHLLPLTVLSANQPPPEHPATPTLPASAPLPSDKVPTRSTRHRPPPG